MLITLSLGAGVQSTALALMSAEGFRDLPKIDAAVFADTGWEPPEVYRHLDWLEVELAGHDIPVHRVTGGNLRVDATDPSHRFASMPLFVVGVDGRRGMLRRQCTNEYKIRPVERELRKLAGLKPRQRGPRDVVLVEQWLGISLDEIHRMSSDRVSWITKAYPLIDLRLTRHDCRRWLTARGITAPRSACVGCPFRSNAEWRHLRDTDHAAWLDAVDFDRSIRSGEIARAGHQQLLGEAFLHRSMVPLDEVDLSTEEERGQGSLFDDGPAECGLRCGTAPVGFATFDPYTGEEVGVA